MSTWIPICVLKCWHVFQHCVGVEFSLHYYIHRNSAVLAHRYHKSASLWPSKASPLWTLWPADMSHHKADPICHRRNIGLTLLWLFCWLLKDRAWLSFHGRQLWVKSYLKPYDTTLFCFVYIWENRESNVSYFLWVFNNINLTELVNYR